MKESVWVSADTQQKATKKREKHQNMSEWIITIPRHKGMEREEGRKEQGERRKVERMDG